MSAVRWSWRDWSALAALLLVSIVCLPIFLCMAPWVDATFYDICARIIQRGGVLYRDSFDTNLPGMAWLHLAIRSLFGWRSEVIRAADFVVVAGIIYLLVRWDPSLLRDGRMWTAAILLFYYFSTSEWCQNQRDVWMLLPCLAALYLRRRQLLATLSANRTFFWAGLEGLLWGAAVWSKPMALFPAVACWLFGVLWRCRTAFVWRPILREGTGLLMGGLVAGSAGSLWLWKSGAWPSFWDIMLNWNPEYQDYFMRWPLRWRHLKFWCVTSMPWCLVHLAALPLAGFALAGAMRRSETPIPERLAQALLAILYLSWIAQVLLFQGWYPYHLTPPVLLALTLVMTWIRVPAAMWWRFALAFHAFLFIGLAVFSHPGLRPQRLASWWVCITEGSTNGLKDQLALTPQQGVSGGASDWEDLERVAAFFYAAQELEENELLCLHESTMPLYGELNRFLLSAISFMAKRQAFIVLTVQMLEEVSASRARYAVSDLGSIGWRPYQSQEQTVSHTQRPIAFSKPMTEAFPWSEPIVFHCGRYAVHRIDTPIRKLWP